MTNFMEKAVKEGFDHTLENKFLRAIDILDPLGFRIFRFNNGQLSTSLTDAIFVNLMANIDQYEKMKTEKINKVIQILRIDEEFRKYTGSDSSSKSRVKNRMNRADKIFKEFING